jgi:hypothetical protein
MGGSVDGVGAQFPFFPMRGDERDVDKNWI